MRLHVQSDSGVTIIENMFIDRYMPAANGEFVKLYLYLLRCAGTGRELSISSVADFFDHTEKDVKRALAYWEKLGLMHLTYDPSGSISDILFSGQTEPDTPSAPIASNPPAGVSPAAEPASDPLPSSTIREVPDKHSMSAARRAALAGEDNIQTLIHVYSTYIGRPLTSAETGNIMYFYDQLGFSFELIDYLIEYCVAGRNTGAKYMEKVAQEWYREGITTVPQAKESSAGHNQDYYSIFKALGIRGRFPAAAETAIMDCWLHTWKFPMDLITEACERTILQAHEPSLTYANKILESWHDRDVHSLEDVSRLDASFAAKTAARPRRTPQRKNTGAGIASHEYDWNELEQQLIRAQEGE